MTIVQKRVGAFFSVFVAIILVGLAIIKLAQGYRPDLSNRSLMPTGLLVATSAPDGASIYIDSKLKSATNDTLNLSPDDYEIEIKKDGFFPWKKKLTVKKELVTKTDAYLFATYPDLKRLTFTGADQPFLSPDGQKVAFKVATASANKKGLWVLDLADRPLGLSREARQILESAPRGRDFSLSSYSWSPDSKQLLVKLPARSAGGQKEAFLVDASRLNPATSLVNVSQELKEIQSRWEAEEKLKNETELARLPPKLLEAINQKTGPIQLSLDETKILYTATAAATIPDNIIPAIAAASTQKESRQIEASKIYVYDLKEDKNFYIADAPKTKDQKPKSISWFPTSKHIFIVQSDKISIGEYDGTNWMDVYTGPFENSFAFPFPAGNRILVLTSIGKDTPPNLYAITLR